MVCMIVAYNSPFHAENQERKTSETSLDLVFIMKTNLVWSNSEFQKVNFYKAAKLGPSLEAWVRDLFILGEQIIFINIYLEWDLFRVMQW